MTTLLELKEKLTRFYGKYDVYITPERELKIYGPVQEEILVI